MNNNVITLKYNLNRSITTWVLLFAIVCLMILRDVNGIAINKFIFVILCFLCFVNKEKSDIYKSVAFLTPFAGGLPYTYIIVLAQLFVLVREKGRRRFDIISFICIFLILFMELVSIVHGYFSFVAYVEFAVILWFSFTRMSDLDYDYDNVGIANAYIAGFFAAMINIFAQVLKQYSWTQLLNMGSVLIRFGSTNDSTSVVEQGMRLSFNPNGLACICVQVVFIALLLHYRSRKKYYLIISVISVIIGLMTQSRTFIIVTALMLVFYLLLTKKNIKTVVSSIGIAAVFAISVYYIVTKWFSSYIEGIRIRMQAVDITNGRGDLLHTYNQFIMSRIDRFLFGVGLQNYPEKYNFYQSSHNAIQEVIIAWGVIGLFVVVIFFARVLTKAYKRVGKINIVYFIPIVATLLIMQAGQGFRDEVGILRLAVMYSVILIPYDNSIHSD